MAEKVIDLNRHIPVEKPHLPTHISESGLDSVVWECDQDFEITHITPRNPFFRNFPVRATQSLIDLVFRVNSGAAKAGTKGTVNYHSHFRVVRAGAQQAAGGDPDIIIDD